MDGGGNMHIHAYTCTFMHIHRAGEVVTDKVSSGIRWRMRVRVGVEGRELDGVDGKCTFAC